MKTIFAGVLLCLSTMAANAAVVSFDNPVATSGGRIVATYQESGFNFSGHFTHSSYDQSDGFPAVTARLDFAVTSHLEMTRTDGSLFDLNSIDLGEYSSVFAGQRTQITILGKKADDSYVSQTFQIDGLMSGLYETDRFETFLFSSQFTDLQAAYIENNSSDYETYYGPLPDDYPDEFNTTGFSIDKLSATVVPVPAAVWLFGSALGMLGWMRRRP